MNEPDYYWNRPLPTPEEFERLADEILDPILKRLGYTRGPRKRCRLYICMYYQRGERTLKIYYEARDPYTDIRFQGPGMDALHNLLFVCKRLGRPYKQYETNKGSLRDRLEALANLVQEQVSDVLTGNLEFRFSNADAQEHLFFWEQKKLDLANQLFEWLRPLGFVELRHSGYWRDRHSITRRTPLGSNSVMLSTRVSFFGVGVEANVAICLDAVETLFREVDRAASGGTQAWRTDTNTIEAKLHPLDGEDGRGLSIGSEAEFDETLNRLSDRFQHIGAPFLEQGSSLEGAYEILKDGLARDWDIWGDEVGRMERALCLACLLRQYRDALSFVRRVTEEKSSSTYGRAELARFMVFVECLRAKYPDLPTEIH